MLISPLTAGAVDWLKADDDQEAVLDPDPALAAIAGEMPARKAWEDWLHKDTAGVGDYDKLHDFPGPDATSHLSIALRWGHLHPRTVLGDLRPLRSKGPTP